MKLKLIRETFSKESTIGQLYIDDVPFCFVLEDVTRPEGEKVKGKTSIPYGTYEVVIAWSNRFKRQMPRLLNVPMFDGILIHQGNTAKDTEGCLLLGSTKGVDFVGHSRETFAKFYPLLEEGLKEGKVFIEITKDQS